MPPPAPGPDPWWLKIVGVVGSEGGGATPLVSQQFLAGLPKPEDANLLSVNQFDWQPGSRMLTFGTKLVAGYGRALSDDIHLVAADSGMISSLLLSGKGGTFVFSSDGQRLAFSRPDSNNVINVDGSDPRQGCSASRW